MTKNQCVFGLHAVALLLTKQPERVLRLCVSQNRQDQKIRAILELANAAGVPVEKISRSVLDGMTDAANHQGVAAFCRPARNYTEKDLPALLKGLKTPPLLLVLDGVQDPHNLGACFRSADAAGVHAIIVPKNNAVGLTPVVRKVASGAAEIVPFVQVTNLVRAMETLKEMGIWIYGADADAEQALYQAEFDGPAAIVLGAEGSGLRRLTREHCDMLLNVPMQGSVASLNVSVAAGIFLFEAVRQRMD